MCIIGALYAFGKKEGFQCLVFTLDTSVKAFILCSCKSKQSSLFAAPAAKNGHIIQMMPIFNNYFLDYITFPYNQRITKYKIINDLLRTNELHEHDTTLGFDS